MSKLPFNNKLRQAELQRPTHRDEEFDEDYERSWGPRPDPEEEAEINTNQATVDPSYTKHPRYNKNFNREKFGKFFNDDGTFKLALTKEYFKLIDEENADVKTAAPGGGFDDLATMTPEEWQSLRKTAAGLYDEYDNKLKPKKQGATIYEDIENIVSGAGVIDIPEVKEALDALNRLVAKHAINRGSAKFK